MSYAEAKAKYAAFGADADRAMETLKTIPVCKPNMVGWRDTKQTVAAGD